LGSFEHQQQKLQALKHTRHHLQFFVEETKLYFSVCYFWLVREAVVLKSQKPQKLKWCRKRSAKANYNRSAESPATATLDPAEAEERQPPRTPRATIDAH